MDYFAAPTTASSGTSNPMTTSSNNSKQSKNKKKGPAANGGGGGSYCCKLSTDPQSVAARERRHRISDRFKILQSLVPGGSKMDTVSMLEQAINYVKFLKAQILLHQTLMDNTTNTHHHHADEYRNEVEYYNEDPAAASFYFTGHPTTSTFLQADSGSADLGGSANSYCSSHLEACSGQLMCPAPEYFVGHGGDEGMRYL